LDSKAEWAFDSRRPNILSNCAWACATLGAQSPNLFRLLVSYAYQLLEKGTFQDVTHYVWAMAEHGPMSENIISLVDQKAE
jgi:hypothetical protein